MNPEEDAYGQEMWAYYKGERSFEIAERDDGYIDAKPTPKVYFSSYEEWPPHERRRWDLLREEF